MNLSWKTLLQLFVVLLATVDAATVCSQTPGSAFLGTRWDLPGPKDAVISPPTLGGTFGPGAADWSIVAAGITALIPPDSDHLLDPITLDFDKLLPPANAIRPVTLFELALNIWDVGSLGAWSNLGNAIDGGGDIGDNVAVGNTSDTGDIRAAVLRWDEEAPLSSQFNTDVIAHAFQPDTLAAMLVVGTIGGDAHFRPHAYGPDGLPNTGDEEENGVIWVDDPLAPAGTVDLLTVMIHEVGHALGLDHNVGDMGSVMQPVYTGPKRSLSTTDKRNIRQLYGLAVPEPTCAILLGIALPWLCSRRLRS